jgi:hypothetical protein
MVRAWPCSRHQVTSAGPITGAHFDVLESASRHLDPGRLHGPMVFERGFIGGSVGAGVLEFLA